MRLFIFIFFSISISSCGPISMLLKSEKPKQDMMSEINISHWPGNKVEITVYIKLKNVLTDTLWLKKQDFIRIVSITNLLDSLQFNIAKMDKNPAYLLPNQELQFRFSYWSNTFNEKLSIFKKETVNERAVIYYSGIYKNDFLILDSIFLKPDSQIISNWAKRKIN